MNERTEYLGILNIWNIILFSLIMKKDYFNQKLLLWPQVLFNPNLRGLFRGLFSGGVEGGELGLKLPLLSKTC